MHTRPRYRYASGFDARTSFDEQLYVALRQSPWWMLSIAIHVLVLVIAGILTVQTVAAAPPSNLIVRPTSEVDDPPEPLPDEPSPEDRVRPSDIPAPDPLVTNKPESEVPALDQDLPFEQPLGEEGLSDDNYAGPQENGWLGLAGGAGGRFGRGRGTPRDASGGTGPNGATERAVEDALSWLAAHQSPDGGWDTAGFGRWCNGQPMENGPDGAGKGYYDAGVTGLATLAFLGAGYTQRGRHRFAKTVRRALRYLRNIQDAEGCFGPRATQHYIYNHATAALAMVEAYGMTESPVLKGPAQRALDFISLARNPYFAWRYGVRPGENDTSVTGWMMMAMKSARLINTMARERGGKDLLAIDEEAFDGVRAWIDKMTDPDTGRVGYIQRGGRPARPQELIDRFPSDRSESMTAVGVLARIFGGEDPARSKPVKQGAALCAALPPIWNPEDGRIDMYYWYYATLAMYQVGGRPWKTWNTAMKPAIVEHQRRDTDFCHYRGSWDPIGPWGSDGGRVYATALMAMCLEVYYRYDRVFGAN
ncbi:MAG: prenyltransferase/squalene oxidase repeat-containing protein [Planctomycetota bacterium]